MSDDANLLPKGRYTGRAVSAALGMTGGDKPQVAVMFELVEPAGWRIGWYGYFSEKTEESTLKGLFACGWDGEDIRVLNGIDQNEVELVVDIEENEDKNGQRLGTFRNRVRWVNPVGDATMLLNKTMDDATAAQFATAMRGRAAQLKQKLQSGKSAAPAAKGAAGADAPPPADEPPPWMR
jgi:hypothetical protein